MGALVTYGITDGVATITMDDGKVNVLSPAMQSELNQALDRAEAEEATVVLRGRQGIFSAGFDLAILRSGGPEAEGMLRGGFELAERILSFPRPLVVGCPGHAVAMGLFLLLSGDYRIGVAGPYTLRANEVAIGLMVPRAALEVCRLRMTPSAFNRATILAEAFSPDDGVAAGLLDQVVDDGEALAAVAQDQAVALSQLDSSAHVATKLAARATTLEGIRAGIEAEYPVRANGAPQA